MTYPSLQAFYFSCSLGQFCLADPDLTVSSKADIFEAKVATAVDEANSSDSEETFVYESNPPEPYAPRSARLSSRTPSVTSLTSQVDQRSKSVVRENPHRVAGKRSMKFANYNSNLDSELGGGPGGVRGGGIKPLATPRQHHITRHSRGPSHTGLFDLDSPFTHNNKLTSPRLPFARSRPTSPRFTGNRTVSSPRKTEADPDEADEGIADDERMPLIGSIRVNRTRHNKRPTQGSIRLVDYYGEEAEAARQSPISRHTAFVLFLSLFLVLSAAAAALLVAVSKGLVGVSIAEIDNVLATEQELMFDLNVVATNPNLFTLTISDLNMDVFAKSGFAGTAARWREEEEEEEEGRWRRRPRPWLAPDDHTVSRRYSNEHNSDDDDADDDNENGNHDDDDDFVHHHGVDQGTDPIEDPGDDPQTMVLGRVFEFDNPLSFESSPIRRSSTRSTGGIRLTQPGNRTEEGGSARWERVLQHPFELILGGALKYQLPLSSKTHSVSVRSTISVDPRKDRKADRGADESMT